MPSQLAWELPTELLGSKIIKEGSVATSIESVFRISFLFCVNSNIQGFRILQARILEWIAIAFSRGSSRPRDRPAFLLSPVLAGGIFTTSPTWEAPGIG